MGNDKTNGKDYFGVVLIAVVFTVFYFDADYLEYPNWIRYVLGGVGGIFGFIISHVLRNITLGQACYFPSECIWAFLGVYIIEMRKLFIRYTFGKRATKKVFV